MAHSHRVIALFGPTGVGKTAVAVAIAERLRERGEDPLAISADALQVYEGLEILTGAPTAAERARLEHGLVSCVPLTETFSAGRFARLAHAEIDQALAAGRTPIVVGGTGLYLQAALTDLELRPPPPAGLRDRLTAELDERGARGAPRRPGRPPPRRGGRDRADRPHARDPRPRADRDGRGAGCRRATARVCGRPSFDSPPSWAA